MSLNSSDKLPSKLPVVVKFDSEERFNLLRRYEVERSLHFTQSREGMALFNEFVCTKNLLMLVDKKKIQFVISRQFELRKKLMFNADSQLKFITDQKRCVIHRADNSFWFMKLLDENAIHSWIILCGFKMIFRYNF